MSGINELDRQSIEAVTGYQFPPGTAMDTLDEAGRRRSGTERATGVSTALPTPMVLTRRGGTRSGERPAYREEMQALLEARSGRHRSPLTGEIIDTATDAASDLRFMTEATQLLGLALQHPSELADSTLKTQMIGLLAEAAKAGGIVLSNTLSTLTRQHLGIEGTGAKAAATAAYAAGTLIADTFNPDLISWATRRAGGVEPRTYFSVRKGASALGAYNEIAAATLINMVKSVGYGAITVGIDSTPTFSGYGRVAVALMGAVGNAIPSQLINHGLNAMTLNRAGVSSHRELPPLRHNHDPRVGGLVSINTTPVAYSDRTTAKEKAIEVALRGGASVAKGMAFIAAQTFNPFDPVTEGARYQAFTVFVGFQVAAIAQGLATAAVARLRTDPAQHRQRYAIISNELLCRNLRNSSLRLRAASLNSAANALCGPGPGGTSDETSSDAEMRALFASAANLMRPDGPARFRDSQETDDIDLVKEFFAAQKTKYISEVQGDHDGNERSQASLHRAGELINFIIADLEQLKALKRDIGEGKKYGPFMTDMVQRTRELSSLLLQADVLSAGNDADKQKIAELTFDLVPVLAALRKSDRQPDADRVVAGLRRIDTLSSAPVPPGDDPVSTTYWQRLSSGAGSLFNNMFGAEDERTTLAQGVLSELRAPADKRVYGNDIVDVVKETAEGLKPGAKEPFLRGMIGSLETVLDAAGHAPGDAGTKMQVRVMMNGVQRMLHPAEPQADQKEAAVRQAILRFTDYVPPMPGALPGEQDPRVMLERAIAEGRIDVATLCRFIGKPEDPSSHGVSDVIMDEAAEEGDAASGAARQQAAERQRAAFIAAAANLQIALSPDEISALQAESGVGTVEASVGRELLDSFAQDIRNMDHNVRTLFEAGFYLGRSPGPRLMPVEQQYDSHQHHDNFNGLTVDLENQAKINEAVNILAATYMGIPHQILNPRPEVVYYGNNDKSWVYAGNEHVYKQHDFGNSVLSLTALNLHVPQKVELEMINQLRADPADKLKWIGEITAMKYGGVTDNALAPVADVKQFAKYVFVPAARLGYGVTMHHDIGPAHGNLEYGSDIIDAIKVALNDLKTQRDPLQGGVGDNPTPDPKLSVVIPHFGMSPQNSGGAGLSKWWDDTLKDPELADVLSVDASWSFTTKNIMNDIRDSLATISPQIGLALDTCAVAYSAFLAQGTVADKNTDLGRLMDEAAVHKVAADSIVDFYVRAIDFSSKVIEDALADEETARQVQALALVHGNNGNNWIYLFAQYSHRIMFGTDNLASEVKIHGQAELLADALALHPVYALFKQLAKLNPTRYENVVANIARNTWQRTFQDEDLTARRGAARQFYTEAKPSEGRRAPDNVTRYVERDDDAVGRRRVERTPV